MEPGSRSVEAVLLAAITTPQPSRAKPRASARPMPRLAPVMTAILAVAEVVTPMNSIMRVDERNDNRLARQPPAFLAGHHHGVFPEAGGLTFGSFVAAGKVRYCTLAAFLNSSKLILPLPTWSSCCFEAETISFAGRTILDWTSPGLTGAAAWSAARE